MRPLLLAAAVLAAGCTRAEAPVALPPTATAPAALAGWPARLDALTGQALGPNGAVTARGVTLGSLRTPGRPTLFAFWASYCPPCLAELPTLQALAEDGAAVVGVGMDGDDVPTAARLLAEGGARYPNLVLDTASMKAAGKALEAGLPFTLVVDAGGVPRVALYGRSERATFEAALAAAAGD